MSATTLTATEVSSILVAALEAREMAYCPYSKFRVGAALLTEGGELVKGCNVENASYGAGICAERTALTRAVSEGKQKFKAIAVSSDIPSPTVSPCGICRQFIREFCTLQTPIYMIGSNVPVSSLTSFAEGDGAAALEELLGREDGVKMMTLGELLPMSFGPEHLELERK